MPIFIHRFLQVCGLALRGWRLPLVIAVFVFLTSWFAMWLVEPRGSDIASAGNYWWYFIVTAATVGYGDFFPATTLGHVVGAYVIVGGIVTLTVLFTRMASYVQVRKGKTMRGLVDHDVKGHIVILGYTPGRTERLVNALLHEGRRELVLCAWDDVADSDPMPEQSHVHFVRGDLTHVDVMQRACVADAETVMIDGRDDNETLTIAVAVDHVDPRVHMVAALRDMNRAEHLHYVNAEIQCVQWHMPKLLIEEIVDPGITQVYTDLMTEHGTGNTYSMPLPAVLAGRTFGECQTLFGQRHGATLIAVRRKNDLAVSPSWDTPLDDQMIVYYLARRRLKASELA